MEERINPDTESIDIDSIYLDVCIFSSQIRTKVTTRGPGNVDSMFRTFKMNFDLLFTLTCDSKDIVEYNKDLVANISKWLSLQTPKPNNKNKYIFDGIKLFDEYKSRLISYKTIGVR